MAVKIPPVASPLTQDHAQKLHNVIGLCSQCDVHLRRMREAGMPAEVAEQQNENNRQIALGLLRVYFPDQIGG